MTTQSTELIIKISQKLGIDSNSNTVSKAREHIRNLNAKSKITVNELVKAIICLDIATTQLGEKFDKRSFFNLEKSAEFDPNVNVHFLKMARRSILFGAESGPMWNLFRDNCQIRKLSSNYFEINMFYKDFCHQSTFPIPNSKKFLFNHGYYFKTFFYKLTSDIFCVTALKLAVLTKSQYQKNYVLIKNLLQIETNKSIHEICIQLTCEEASKSAELLLHKYKEYDNICKDFSHPQYAVAAVYTICKLQKISVKKSDFVSLSTLKPQQWTKLENEFNKFIEEQNFTADITIKSTKRKGNEYLNIIQQQSAETEQENEMQNTKEAEMAAESYEIWRKRILAEAYAHCGNI